MGPVTKSKSRKAVISSQYVRSRKDNTPTAIADNTMKNNHAQHNHFSIACITRIGRSSIHLSNFAKQ